MKIKDNIAAEFDEFSKNYTKDMRGVVPHYDMLLSCFGNRYPENFTPKQILDLGCGNGNVTAVLLKIFPEAEYTLLDASQEMLNNCKKRFHHHPDFSYTASYFNEYQFPSNYFDLIVGGFSIHHCPEQEKKELYKHIYQALKPQGVFACSDLMIERSATAHPKLLKDWQLFVIKSFPDDEKWEWLMEHYHQFDHPNSLENQLSWLQSVGFNNFEITVRDSFWVHLKAKK